MRFQITSSAFVNGEYIAADVRNPAVREFDADIDLDNIGPRWVPLDDEAKDALVRLDTLARQRQIEGGVEKPVGKTGKVAPIEAAPSAVIQGGTKSADTMSEASRPAGKK
jgi:hypothetical protein